METVLGMTDLQIRLFTAIGQISVAIAVGFIAYRQWKTAQAQAETARKKLKADLFDRRFTIYKELVDLTTKVLIVNSDEEAGTGLSRTRAAYQLERVAQEMLWVFDREVALHVKEHIADAALALVFKEFDQAACNDDELSEELTADLTIGHRELHNNLMRATSLVGPYLKLSH